MQNCLKTHENEVILWGTPISPYVRKVMIALEEKNIPYKQHDILPRTLLEATGQIPPRAFKESSPLGKIPAIQIGNYNLSDSAVISRYLERKFHTGNNIYPQNPELYAKAIWFENYSDTVLTDTCYKKIFLEGVIKPKVLNIKPNTNLIKNAIENELPPLLNFMNNALADQPYFSGNDFSMADVAVATQLLAITMYGVAIDDTYHHLKNHLTHITSRVSFSKIRT